MSDKDDEEQLLFEMYGAFKPKSDEINQEQVERWKREGLCNQCGFRGYFNNFSYVCPQHGVYTGQ